MLTDVPLGTSGNSRSKGAKMTKFAAPFMKKEVPVVGGVGRNELRHAHLDIRGETPLSPSELEVLASLKDEVQSFGFLVDDQPFCRFRQEEVEEMLSVK